MLHLLTERVRLRFTNLHVFCAGVSARLEMVKVKTPYIIPKLYVNASFFEDFFKKIRAFYTSLQSRFLDQYL